MNSYAKYISDTKYEYVIIIYNLRKILNLKN